MWMYFACGVIVGYGIRSVIAHRNRTSLEAKIKEAHKNLRDMLDGKDVSTLPREWIVRDPDVRSGQPVLNGTRFPVSLILAELAEGRTVQWIAETYDQDLDAVAGAVGEISKDY